MKTTSRLLGLCLSLSMLFALPACSGGQSASSAPAETTPAPTESSAAEESHYPVTVTTYNQNGEEAEQTFTKCPERVVSISQANTEMLVSLGLSDLIVATAHRTSTPWPETAAEYESLNFLAMDDYPSKEVVLSLEPDLIVGWGSLFADDALGATSDWNDRGINTYLMKNTVSGLGKRNFEFLIQDIENFGKIFDIEEKTDALVADIRSRLAAVEARTADIPEDERPTVLTVQMLKDNEWFARAATDLTANIIELAGGKCLDEEYGYASMEVLIDKNPDAILVIDRETKPAADTIQGLLDNPALQEVTAIKNQNFYTITHVSFYCGRMQTIEDIEGLSEMLHK